MPKSERNCMALRRLKTMLALKISSGTKRVATGLVTARIPSLISPKREINWNGLSVGKRSNNRSSMKRSIGVL